MLHLHEGFNGFGFDENGNGIKLCLSQPLDGIARHIQDAVLPLERRQAGSDLPTQSTLCGKQLAHTDVLEKGGATEMKPQSWDKPAPSGLTFLLAQGRIAIMQRTEPLSGHVKLFTSPG